MARRSVLVYDLLRTEQPPGGFSRKEILTRISGKYDVAAGKGLERDVAIALRRGLDFGILAKKGNKFRFEPDFCQPGSKRNNGRTSARRRKRKGSSKRKAAGRLTATKERRRRRRRQSRQRQKQPQQRRQRRRSTSRGRSRGQSATVPRPKLPKPPSWSPKRRYLADEPIPKVFKHS